MLSEVAFSFCLLAVLVVVVEFYLKEGTMSLMAAFFLFQNPAAARPGSRGGQVGGGGGKYHLARDDR